MQVEVDQLPFSDESRQQVELVNNLMGAQYFTGNEIEVFTQGKDKFDALKRDLEAAKTEKSEIISAEP